jgi:SAM-dependent methyltransferase
MKFYKETRIYLITPMGWKHWDMQGGVIDDSSVTLINRGRVEHVYGIQNMPRTASGVQSAYDELATTWDRDHGMNDDEKRATASIIRGAFGDKLWRTLDVGCGTGLPLDLGLAEPVRYVGIDPSTAMLNALVMKYPVLAGVHPMTYAEAERRRMLCGTKYDTVFALGGSASYLTPDDIEQLRCRATRKVLLMHYSQEASPSVADLDPKVAEVSLRAATTWATSQTRAGRFTASVLSAKAAVLS